jgi:hypothetical protein
MDLWFIKYKLLADYYDFKQLCKRKLFCRIGMHDVSGATKTTVNSRGVELHSEFVRCKNCNLCFFPSQKDKEHFLRMQEQEIAHTKDMQDLMKEMISKNGR